MGEKYKIINQLKDQGGDTGDEIARLVKHHGAITPVADNLNVTPRAISYHLKLAGYTKGWYQVPDDDIVAKYTELKDENAVALHFNIAQSYVHDALLRVLLSGQSDE